MEKNAKIFVAGHRGLVGSAILKNLQEKGYQNFVLRTHKELDLDDARNGWLGIMPEFKVRFRNQPYFGDLIDCKKYGGR